MALTRNNLTGFETGGLEEAVAIAGTPDATEAVVVRSGARSLKMDASGDQYDLSWVADGVTDAGNDYIIGYAYRQGTAQLAFMVGAHDTVGRIWRLQVTTGGAIVLIDADGAIAGTSGTGVISAATWHFIEVYFQHSASGSAEVFVDGISVIGPLSMKDFTDGGTISFLRFQGDGAPNYFDDVYILSGATGASDRLGNANGDGVEVFKYQSVKNSATPDDGGTVLNAGTWNRAGETPLAATATNPEYTGAGAGAVDSNAADGSPEGPLNDPRIDGDLNIKAIKGIWNMKRSGGGGSDHFGLLGNDVDGTIPSQDFDPTTSFANFFFLSELATVVPTSAEYCRIGFETTGAQDFECQEMWAMLLHVPTAPVLTALSQADFPDQNYYVGPFEI